MGISFSQEHILGFPSNEVVRLLMCGHACICIRVGFKKWNKILILCSIVLGTRYIMGSDKDYVEELKSKLQESKRFIENLMLQSRFRNDTIFELTSSMRQGIQVPSFLYCRIFIATKKHGSE